MSKLSLSERERYTLFHHFNVQPVNGRAEQRRVDKLWSILDLDAIALHCEGSKEMPRATDFSDERREYELSDDQRDMMIDYLDRPMTSGLSRYLFPIGNELIRQRDGGEE